jgi:hypothetical protein
MAVIAHLIAQLCNSNRTQTPYNNGKAQACLEVWQAKFEAEYKK